MTDQKQHGLYDILGHAHLIGQDRDTVYEFAIAMLLDVSESTVDIPLNQDILIIVVDAQMLLHQG